MNGSNFSEQFVFIDVKTIREQFCSHVRVSIFDLCLLGTHNYKKNFSLYILLKYGTEPGTNALWASLFRFHMSDTIFLEI